MKIMINKLWVISGYTLVILGVLSLVCKLIVNN